MFSYPVQVLPFGFSHLNFRQNNTNSYTEHVHIVKMEDRLFLGRTWLYTDTVPFTKVTSTC